VKQSYTFNAPNGPTSLLDLFEGRTQLIVYHFMFDPDSTEGCSSCSMVGDNVGHIAHLHSRDTTFAAVSRAPLEKIAAFQKRMGWTFPWYSSGGSSFNYDFHVTQDEAVTPIEYNFMDKDILLEKKMPYFTRGEQPGLSVFLREGDRVYHTYSAYSRGLEKLVGTYSYLDLTPLGRQENRPGGIGRFSLHDTYATEA
ncbi:MAG: hypothetical protein M1833_002760, partial [Piccolia ochrophora]